MARAKNAILNAVGDSSENVITDMRNMLGNENFKFIEEEVNEKETEMENNDMKRRSIFQIEEIKTDDKEDLEDIQVSGLPLKTMFYNLL